jgi:transcriptional regulator with XRE-family HTH domain
MSVGMVSREELGRRISALQGYLQISQGGFGEPAGVHRNTIAAWEKATMRVSLEKLEELCQHWFGRTALELLSPDWDSRVWSKAA